jgi:hypothetical protein
MLPAFRQLIQTDGVPLCRLLDTHLSQRRRVSNTHRNYSSVLNPHSASLANRVDLLVGDRTQKGIDEHLVALIDREASIPC